MKERRKKEGYKLRVYMDAIKDSKKTTDSQWIEAFIKYGERDGYLTRSAWISYLEKCALQEAKVLLQSKP